MGATKKPRKQYKPKPNVLPLGIKNAQRMEFPGYAASLALGQAHFCEQHVYDLLSNADMVRRIAPDNHEILPIAQRMVEAVAEIQNRAQRTGKHGVTGDELRVLREGLGLTMDYLRTVPNVAIDRAARAAVAEFNKRGALRV
ncbi:hypothetical protein ACHMW6_06310 [Pseudoduganella sp. UC29_106]|uniref:hypothetical protein n=1 Tax=Pseudoduganella sp. UC29_106 TaxID=3374553 RepID=UPI0037562EE8